MSPPRALPSQHPQGLCTRELPRRHGYQPAEPEDAAARLSPLLPRPARPHAPRPQPDVPRHARPPGALHQEPPHQHPLPQGLLPVPQRQASRHPRHRAPHPPHPPRLRLDTGTHLRRQRREVPVVGTFLCNFYIIFAQKQRQNNN